MGCGFVCGRSDGGCACPLDPRKDRGNPFSAATTAHRARGRLQTTWRLSTRPGKTMDWLFGGGIAGAGMAAYGLYRAHSLRTALDTAESARRSAETAAKEMLHRCEQELTTFRREYDALM